jgi:hypothetical protein
VLDAGFENVNKKEKMDIAHTICTYHSYMSGYPSIVGSYTSVQRWVTSLRQAQKEGRLENVFRNNKKIRKYLIFVCWRQIFLGFFMNAIGTVLLLLVLMQNLM